MILSSGRESPWGARGGDQIGPVIEAREAGLTSLSIQNTEVRPMAQVKNTILIKGTPVEKVFGYVGEPSNLPEIWPSMVEAKDVQPSPGGGHRFRWVYKMAGMRFEGDNEDIEVVRNERIVSQTKGGIHSKITWTFRPQDNDTYVIFEADYTVPVPLLGKLAEIFIVRSNRREAETLLENLKARMES